MWGNEKGRAERAIRYARDAFFAARRSRSRCLNAQASAWCAGAAAGAPARRSTRTVAALFAEEALSVRLPQPFPAEERLRCACSVPYVRFDLNVTTVPTPMSGAAHVPEPRRAHPRQPTTRHPSAQLRPRRPDQGRHLAALSRAKRGARDHRAQHRPTAFHPQRAAAVLKRRRAGCPLGVPPAAAGVVASHGAAPGRGDQRALAEDSIWAACATSSTPFATLRPTSSPNIVALPADPRLTTP